MNTQKHFSNLSNQELDQKMSSLAQTEREHLVSVINCIKEIDQRKLYLDFNYLSLFEYLVGRFKYSNGQAQRRIDAARILMDVPMVEEKIKSGELTLNKITYVQKALRQKKSESKTTISKEEKKDLLFGVIGLNEADTQKQIARVLDLEIREAQKVNHQQNDSVRVELTFTKAEWDLIQKTKQVLSHEVLENDLAKLLVKTCETTLKTKREVGIKNLLTTKGSAKEEELAAATTIVNSNLISTATVAVKTNKTLTPKTRKLILMRDQVCQHRDPHSKQLCGSLWQLEIDHKQPRWAQGNHEARNLQVLCRKHNQLKYKHEMGLR